MMPCGGCKNAHPYQKVAFYTVKEGHQEICDQCGNFTATTVPDVYWPGMPYESQNLCDKMGQPIPLRSRAHKAQVMKDLGVIETGDKIHGAPATMGSSWAESTRSWRRKQFDKDRPGLRKIYADWRKRNA